VCSTTRTDLGQAIGADHVNDCTHEGPFDGERTYDLIVDTAGNRPVRVLRRGLAAAGTLVIVGGEHSGRWTGGVSRLQRATAMAPLVSQRITGLMATHRLEDPREVVELARSGVLRPVVDRTFPLAEVAEAIRYVRSGAARGKVVVEA
jgi:NADPH:quinone reductase-like Zn-dependent oxidoreductase